MSESPMIILSALSVPLFMFCFFLVITSVRNEDLKQIRVWFMIFTSWLGSLMITYCLAYAVEYEYNEVKTAFKNTIRQEAIAALQYRQ